MKLDFSETKDAVLVPEGTHELTIKKAEEKTSSNGTNMLVLDLITDVDGDEGFLRDNVCIEGPGAFRAKQLFGALGIDIDDASEMNASDLNGMTVTAEVTHEEYEGVNRAKVKKYVA